MAVYCSSCNTANRDGSRYCNTCGASLASPAPIACPACQATALSYSVFCHRCGARLPEPETPVVTPPQPITESDVAAQDEVDEESEVISLDQVPPTATLVQQAALPAAAAETATPKVAAAASAGEDERISAPADAPATDSAAAPAEAAPPPDVQAAAPAPAPVQPLARVRPSVGHRAPSPAPPPAVAAGSAWQRLAYLILAVAVVAGLMLPPGTLGTSTPASPEVKALYSAIESLPAHSLALVSFDYEPTASDEMSPLAQAVITHLMQRKARLLVMSLLPQGPALADQVIGPLAEQHIYSYGLDYVNLGFLPGDEAALAALGGDLPGLFASDFVQARSLSDFPISRAVTTVSSFDLILEISGDENGVRRWVEQVQGRHKVRLAAATSAVGLPLAYPYLQSGQVIGLASGLPAAAQYEQLLGYTGPATRGMDAQSLGHLAILAFVVAGNLALVFARRRR